MGIGYLLSFDEDSAFASRGQDGGRKPRILARVGSPVGNGTNNEAEYIALITGLRHALRLGLFNLKVSSDSLLVVNQIRGAWKVKGVKLKRLHSEATNLIRAFARFEIEHVRREFNAEADDLSRKLLFEEVELPPLPPSSKNGTKSLYDWQAAAARYWHSIDLGAGTISRIFGVTRNLVDAVVWGNTYRSATMDGYSSYLNFLVGGGIEEDNPAPLPSINEQAV
jgi:ribonuclease HI